MSLRVVSGHYGVTTLAVAALAEHDSTRTCSQDPKTAGSSRIQGQWRLLPPPATASEDHTTMEAAEAKPIVT